MNWLLLVLFINGTSQQSPSLTTVAFDTQAACEEAGRWVEAEWMKKAPSFSPRPSWTCKKKI